MGSEMCIRDRCWFVAVPVDENGFSLVGCSMAPGFDFDDFELANRKELTKEYPQHTHLITRFTNA